MKADPIEPLEARIAPASVLTFTDVDGDDVTITSSRGDLAGTATFVNAGVGQQLQALNLGGEFFNANISIVAKRSAANGGDGLVNVGRINATGIDLGTVLVDGDLGVLDAGLAVPGGVACKGLTVQSLGRFDLTTGAPDLRSDLDGRLGKLTVKGDIVQAQVQVFDSTEANGTIGPVFVGGSMLGGAADGRGGIFATGDIGKVNVRGDIVGGTGNATGAIRSSTGNIAGVTVGGSLIGGANPGTTSNDGSGVIRAFATLGPVKIGGDVRGGDGDFSGRISGATVALLEGKVTSVTIGGSLLGGGGGSSGQVGSAAPMGPVKIGGSIEGGGGLSSGAVSSSTKVASVSVGGSLLGGGGDSSGLIRSLGAMGPVKIGGSIFSSSGDRSGSILAGDDLGPVVVKGSIVGNAAERVLISARGQETPGARGDVAIKSLTVGGRVEFADILAGYDSFQLPAASNADAQIGTVIVGGDWIASNLIAGVQAGGNGTFGDSDDAKISGVGVKDDPDLAGAGAVSKIARVIIKGSALGTLADTDTVEFGIEAQQLGSIKIGGSTVIPLTAGAGNDLHANRRPLGATFNTGGEFDFFAFEVPVAP